jgi:hypothetical protein
LWIFPALLLFVLSFWTSAQLYLPFQTRKANCSLFTLDQWATCQLNLQATGSSVNQLIVYGSFLQAMVECRLSTHGPCATSPFAPMTLDRISQHLTTAGNVEPTGYLTSS